MRIGIDMDEVLAESVDFIFEKFNSENDGAKLHKKDIKNYKNIFTSEYPAKKTGDYVKLMEKDIGKYEIKPVKGSIEKVRELKEQGHELFIVTARDSNFFTKYTINWTKKYFSNVFTDIFFADHFTDNHKEKSEICKDYGIELMIEDNLDYAIELAENGIKTILLEKPWNDYRDEKHDEIIKVKDWNGIVI